MASLHGQDLDVHPSRDAKEQQPQASGDEGEVAETETNSQAVEVHILDPKDISAIEGIMVQPPSSTTPETEDVEPPNMALPGAKGFLAAILGNILVMMVGFVMVGLGETWGTRNDLRLMLRGTGCALVWMTESIGISKFWEAGTYGEVTGFKWNNSARMFLVAVVGRSLYLVLTHTLPICEYGSLGVVWQVPIYLIAFDAMFLQTMSTRCLWPPINNDWGLLITLGSAMPCTLFLMSVLGYSLCLRLLPYWWMGLLQPVVFIAFEKLYGKVNRFFYRDILCLKDGVWRDLRGLSPEQAITNMFVLGSSLAEAAKLSMLAADLCFDMESTAWVTSLVSTFFSGILVRSLWLPKFVAVVQKRVTGLPYAPRPDMFAVLIQEMKFLGTYPRYAPWIGLGLARWALGNDFFPSTNVALMFACCLAEAVAEDLVIAIMKRLDLNAKWEPESYEEGEFWQERLKQAMVKKRNRQKKQDTVSLEVRLERAAKVDKFLRKPQHEWSKTVPIWTYLGIGVATGSQAFLMVSLCGGWPFLLGFCSQPGYAGISRGIIWWSDFDPLSPCD